MTISECLHDVYYLHEVIRMQRIKILHLKESLEIAAGAYDVIRVQHEIGDRLAEVVAAKVDLERELAIQKNRLAETLRAIDKVIGFVPDHEHRFILREIVNNGTPVSILAKKLRWSEATIYRRKEKALLAFWDVIRRLKISKRNA